MRDWAGVRRNVKIYSSIAGRSAIGVASLRSWWVAIGVASSRNGWCEAIGVAAGVSLTGLGFAYCDFHQHNPRTQLTSAESEPRKLR